MSTYDTLSYDTQTMLNALNDGRSRVAYPVDGQWVVNTEAKKAVLDYLRTQAAYVHNEPGRAYDKVPLKYTDFSAEDFQALGSRIVPGAIVRHGAYIGPNCVLMPAFVNIGAYVGAHTMIDTWATVGSCAQIGERVHISGGVGIGGVLEPLQAQPVIIENDCFIGARSEITEGVHVEQGAVIGMGVYLSQSTKIYDRQRDKVTYGRIPAGAVVVPGSLPSQQGQCHLACAVIVKYADEATRKKTSINELLRTL